MCSDLKSGWSEEETPLVQIVVFPLGVHVTFGKPEKVEQSPLHVKLNDDGLFILFETKLDLIVISEAIEVISSPTQ